MTALTVVCVGIFCVQLAHLALLIKVIDEEDDG